MRYNGENNSGFTMMSKESVPLHGFDAFGAGDASALGIKFDAVAA